jgi:hypothetical protein
VLAPAAVTAFVTRFRSHRSKVTISETAAPRYRQSARQRPCCPILFGANEHSEDCRTHHTLRPLTNALCSRGRHRGPPRRLLASCSGSSPWRRLGSAPLWLLCPPGLWLLGLSSCRRCYSCCWRTRRSGSSRSRSRRSSGDSCSSSTAQSGDGRRQAATWGQRRRRSRWRHCVEGAAACLRKATHAPATCRIATAWLPGNTSGIRLCWCSIISFHSGTFSAGGYAILSIVFRAHLVQQALQLAVAAALLCRRLPAIPR